MNQKTAIQHINRHGILLVYPIHNRPEPLSLWSCFFPRTPMRWEWDTDGDRRVAELWHLREELSRSDRVVYAKWYQGRATLFSREAFTALLALMNHAAPFLQMRESREMLAILRENSPLSTKQLKRAAELEGKFFESTYQRCLKELWSRLLIVGYGEVDDGAFPSLAVGAASLMFEELFRKAETMDEATAEKKLGKILPESSPFLRQISRLRKGWKRETDTLIAAVDGGPQRAVLTGTGAISGKRRRSRA